MTGYLLCAWALALGLAGLGAVWFLRERLPRALAAAVLVPGSVVCAGLGLYLLLAAPIVLL